MNRDNWASRASDRRRSALLAAAIILGSSGTALAGPLPGEPIAIGPSAQPVQASEDDARAATEPAERTPFEELNAALAEARAKLDELTSAAEIAAITEDLRAELQSARAQNQRLTDELAQARSALDAAQTRLDEADARLEERDEALRQRSAREEALIEAAEQSAADAARLREELAAGKQKLAAIERRSQETQTRMAELKEALSGALADAAELRRRLSNTQNALSAAEEERSSLKERLALLEDAADTAADAARANLLAMEDKIVSLNTALADVRRQDSAADAAGKAPPEDSGDVADPARDKRSIQARAATLPMPPQATPAAARREVATANDHQDGVKPEPGTAESEAPRDNDRRSLARATAALPLEERMQVQALLADLKAEPEERGLRLTVPGETLFRINSDQVQEAAHETLAKVAEVIDIYDGHDVLITGHTDAIGEAAYNETLSERRAALVKAFFVDNFDIDDARLVTRGLGEEQPIASNATRAGRQANRRVEVLLLD